MKELVVTTCQNVERMSSDLRELSNRVSKGQTLLTKASQTENKDAKMEEGESSQGKNGEAQSIDDRYFTMKLALEEVGLMRGRARGGGGEGPRNGRKIFREEWSWCPKSASYCS